MDDINVDSKMRFKIDKDLATFLEVDEWCSFREITLGFLKFNKKTKGDFYDRATTSFNAYKYPYFLQFFPHLSSIKNKKQQKKHIIITLKTRIIRYTHKRHIMRKKKMQQTHKKTKHKHTNTLE